MLYFSLASTSFKGPDGIFNVKLLNIYWRYFKWALIYTFITLFIGVVALFNAIQGLCASRASSYPLRSLTGRHRRSDEIPR